MSHTIDPKTCLLYTFIDTAYLNKRDPERVCQALCEGGSDLIQLRAKGETLDQIKRLARLILPVAESYGVPLVINDHPDLATDLGIPFCHLGQEDFFDSGYTHTRELQDKGFTPKIGLSTHAPEQAEKAIQANPVYIAIGPVFATPTKPTARPVTLDYVRWARDHVSIPWFAIGGIHEENLEQVLNAGASRICVVSAILKKKDIRAACAYFKDKVTGTF